ncbi:MAG: hypothetical protein Q9159_002886 [Coniocarpon cinnabarinum]
MATPKPLDDPATTPLDLYALLSLPNPAANSSISKPDEAAIRRAYRKASLLVHPDRAPPEKREAYTQKFQELSIALDILTSDRRDTYDARLEREGREKREREAYGKKRRKMMEELERRESGGRDAFMKSTLGEADGLGGQWQTPKAKHAGTKRTHEGTTPLSVEQEQEVRRLAELGARKRAEFEERRRRRRSGDVDTLNEEQSPVQRPSGTPLRKDRYAQDTPTRNGSGSNDNSHASTVSTEYKRADAPTFSFSPSAAKGPIKGKSQSLGQSPNAPGGSLFESTMAKLREKQRQKEAMREAQDAAEMAQQPATAET